MTEKIDVRERLVQLGKQFAQESDRQLEISKNNAYLSLDGIGNKNDYKNLAFMHKGKCEAYKDAMTAIDQLRIKIENEESRQG